MDMSTEFSVNFIVFIAFWLFGWVMGEIFAGGMRQSIFWRGSLPVFCNTAAGRRSCTRSAHGTRSVLGGVHPRSG